MASALRDARDLHGWTLERTAIRLLRLAESRGAALSVTRASLRQMISDKRGRRKPASTCGCQKVGARHATC